MRLPAYGLWGWLLAPQRAAEALQQRAVAHVTSGASPAHQAAPPVRRCDHRAVLRDRFAAMDPADAVEIAASSHPDMSHAELAEMLATYGISVSTLDVALVLGEAAVPSVTLDRVERPEPAPVPAIGAQMRPNAATNAPLVKGLSKADAIVTMAQHLGGLKTPAEPIALALAKQDVTADLAYIRDRLAKAREAERKAEEKAAEEAAATVAEQAEFERRHGNGGFL